MNKNEFVNEVYSKAGLSKKDCKLCLDVIIEVIKNALHKGERITFSNFGRFEVNQFKEKTVYSFKTGTTQILQARKNPTFKPSESLKQIVK